MIKRFLKSLKPKKSPKPPRQPIPPERPADIAPGPPELRVEPDATSPDDGGQNISDKDLEADQTDLPAPQNEGGRISPRVLFQDGMDGDQELPTSEGASTSVVAIGGAGGGNQLGKLDVTIPGDGGWNVSDDDPEADHTDLTVPPNEGERESPQVLFQDETDVGQELPTSGASTPGVDYGDQLATEGSSVTGGEIGPTETSPVARKTHENTLLRGAKSNTEMFGSLKAVLEKIPALFADSTETDAVGNRVLILLSPIVALGKRFDSRPSDVAEQRLRADLIRKLNAIEEQLRPFSDQQELPLPTDHIQIVFRLLEDLREAILGYQMATDGHGFIPLDPAEAAILNNVRCAQQAEYRHGNRSGCLRGTRAAILDEIELWTRDFDKPPVYWLNGLAGTGKSTIAKTIAERMFADGRLGASFFCSRDFRDRRNLQAIFPTLAVQLARRYTQFRSNFIQLVRSDPSIVHESLYGQMKKLIVQPLADSTVRTVIVIDALDECKDEEPASAILSVLGQFVAELPTVKFFITGRPESRIRDGFRLPLLAKSTDVFFLHEVEPGQVYNDIWLFLTHNFSELKSRRHGLDGWPTKEQVDLLCERAGGLFIHAVATVKFVDHRNNSPKKQLDRLLQSQGSSVFVGKTKLEADATIDSLYTLILKEAFGGDDRENDPRVRSVLGAVVLAANPLSPSAIAILLGFEPDEVFPVLSSARSLLLLQEDIDQSVRPFHKSFPDFIVDPARCTNQRFRVCPPDQHTELLAGCLAVMNRELERNMCGLPDAAINSEVPDLKTKTEEHVSEALEYACRSWHKHLVGTIPAHVVPILQEFLEKKFLFWLEVLSVLGAAREAVDALEATTRCEWPDASSSLNLVEDYTRFVIAFFEIINTSAPHIYHSALPLSPKKSITHEMYKQHTSPLVRVVRGMPDSWERFVATAHLGDALRDAVWSPCNRFIAVAMFGSVEVLDAVTLGRLCVFENPDTDPLITSRQQLGFSPDSRFLMLCMVEEFISWDLHTGGRLSTIPLELGYRDRSLISFKLSKDGKVVAVAYEFRDDDDQYDTFINTYDLLSGERVGSCRVPEGRMIYPIWIHDGYLRYATIDPRSITTWQSPFTLEHLPVEVTSLPVPDGIIKADRFLFLPSLSRLAFVLGDTIQVWDLKTSKILLKSQPAPDPGRTSVAQYHNSPCGSLSSDGRFFAYEDTAREVCLWKESSAGYLLHQRHQFLTSFSYPGSPLSPNGESIIILLDSKINRWHTRDQDFSLPSGSTEDFTLGFSADKKFAAFGRQEENTVTIIDLQSGEPRWTTNVGVEIGCLGMAGSTVVLVGGEKIVTWNLPSGDNAFNPSIHNVVRTTFLDPSSPSFNLGTPRYMSIFPDLSRIVVARSQPRAFDYSLEVDNMSTGSCLARIEVNSIMRPQFTQDGRQVWAGWAPMPREWEQCEVVEDNESGAMELKLQWSPRSAIFEESSSGYAVPDDGWVLSPSQKRLLWLPHGWRSGSRDRVWGGRFLGLLHGKLSEVVVLECLE